MAQSSAVLSSATIFLYCQEQRLKEPRTGEPWSMGSSAAPLDKRLQRLDVRIGPREQCHFQQYLLFYFILLTGISINRCFPCQYSPVASLRLTQFKYLAFALGLIARVWPHLSHIFPSSPKLQPGNFLFYFLREIQYNQNTTHLFLVHSSISSISHTLLNVHLI